MTDMDTKTRDGIVRAVCDAYLTATQEQVTPEEVLSKARTKGVAVCRRISILIYRRHFERPVVETARMFGRDHATVSYCDKTGLWDIRYEPVTAHTYVLAMKHIGLDVPEWMQVCDYEKPRYKIFARLKDAARYKRHHRKVHERVLFVKNGVCYNVTDGWAKRKTVDIVNHEDGEYFKPMEWTDDEKRRLKEVRDLGLTETR